jgi:aminoglycoside phosphotransferase family enzyme/predicted kinase
VDQRNIIDFLSAPAAHGGQPVERVETHASVVFLTGDRAYKLKRAVRYDYLDFSTPDRRHTMCEAELALNQRTAPAIYERVVPVTRDASGALAIDGTGAAVDWLIVMHRFDQEQLLDRLAARGALPLELMPALADAIARMHANAERCGARGGAAGMAWVIDGNARDFAERAVFDRSLCDTVIGRSRAALAAHAALLDARGTNGLVRRCHGDLHLRNIVLLAGVPTPFDAVEFNDDISCIDVLYDLAFLLMDLWRRSLERHANAVMNAYVRETGDLEGLALLPLFVACRAAVRAKTGAASAALQADAAKRTAIEQGASAYLTLAARLLDTQPARLVAVGGLSGTGKSSLARRLAPGLGAPPGALVVRSDEIRKRLAGVPPTSPLPPEAYTADTSDRVYAALGDVVGRALAAGWTVIADAVFAQPGERAAIERIAESAAVPFAGLWLDAPVELCAQRVEQRRGDASDASAAVVRAQAGRDLGPMRWARIDASRSELTTREQAQAVLHLQPA